VAEEGEVFRKGTVLLGPAEMEGEYAGEELRKEVSFLFQKKPETQTVKSDCSSIIKASGSYGRAPTATSFG
jgi:protein phosphatase 1 regulatory subunit 37